MSYFQNYYTVGQYRWTVGEIRIKLDAVSRAEEKTSLINGDLTVIDSNTIFGMLAIASDYQAAGARTLQAVGTIVLDPKNQQDQAMKELFAQAVWKYQKVNTTQVPPISIPGKEVTIIWDSRVEGPCLSYRDVTTRPGEQHFPSGQIVPGTGGGSSSVSQASTRPPLRAGMVYDKEGYPVLAVARPSGGGGNAQLLMRDKDGSPIYVTTPHSTSTNGERRDADGRILPGTGGKPPQQRPLMYDRDGNLI